MAGTDDSGSQDESGQINEQCVLCKHHFPKLSRGNLLTAHFLKILMKKEKQHFSRQDRRDENRSDRLPEGGHSSEDSISGIATAQHHHHKDKQNHDSACINDHFQSSDKRCAEKEKDDGNRQKRHD